MIKPSDKITFRQARELISRWPASQKFKLLQQLREDTWELELKELFAVIDARRKKLKLSKAQILREIEQGRREFHARRS